MSEPTVGDPPSAGADPEPPAGARAAAPTSGRGRRRDRRKTRSSTRNALEWVAVIVGAIVVAVVVKTVFVQAFRIPSESMDPTLLKGDRVLVNKLSYKLHDVHRGDVIVFNRPADLPAAPGDPDDLIKRVIGLPGDTVTARNGHVYVNDRKLDEPYLPPGTSTLTLRDEYSLERGIKVPKDEVLVMGDNRGNSQDGRVFGPIPEDSIVGRAFVIMWPFSRFGSL